MVWSQYKVNTTRTNRTAGLPDYPTTRTTLKGIIGSTWRVPVSQVPGSEEYRPISEAEAIEARQQRKEAVEKKQTLRSRIQKVEEKSSKEQLKGGEILVRSILGSQLKAAEALTDVNSMHSIGAMTKAVA